MSHSTVEAALDKRALRSRQLLLAAFFELVLERRYAEITVADIIARAGVSRSTFYEHFANKNAILARSLEHPFSVLADAVMPTDNTAGLDALLQHFNVNRSVTRSLLAGGMRRRVAAVLVGMIEQRLVTMRLMYPDGLSIPPRLASRQIAEVLLAPIEAWLSEPELCPPRQLAEALRQSARSVLGALSRAHGRSAAVNPP